MVQGLTAGAAILAVQGVMIVAAVHAEATQVGHVVTTEAAIPAGQGVTIVVDGLIEIA